jgi:hypothetical protein
MWDRRAYICGAESSLWAEAVRSRVEQRVEPVVAGPWVSALNDRAMPVLPVRERHGDASVDLRGRHSCGDQRRGGQEGVVRGLGQSLWNQGPGFVD